MKHVATLLAFFNSARYYKFCFTTVMSEKCKRLILEPTFSW